MRILLTLIVCLTLVGCLSTQDIKPIEQFDQVDVRDLRVRVLVERPAKIEAEDSALEVTVLGDSQVEESFKLKLLGVEFIEQSVGLFASDIAYNVHLLAIDESDYDRFNQFQQLYSNAAFALKVSPSFISLPQRQTMYYSSEVKYTRLGQFRPLLQNLQIDVPR